MRKVFLLILFMFILTACGIQNNDDTGDTGSVMKEPPELTVSSNNKKVAAILGAYDWSYVNSDGSTTVEFVDVDAPPRIVHQQTEQLNTALDSDVNLEFAKSPQEVQVNIWNNSEKVREVEVEDTSFKTDETGYVLYEVIGIWDEGTVHYAVKLYIE